MGLLALNQRICLVYGLVVMSVNKGDFMKRNMNEDLSLDLSQHNEQLNYSVSSIVHNKFEFNLDEDIKEPSYYRNLIEVLNNATEQDLVVLNINSGGGMLDSAISIIDALRNTRANIFLFFLYCILLFPFPFLQYIFQPFPSLT